MQMLIVCGCGQDPSAVVVHTAAQVDRCWRQLDFRAIRLAKAAHDCGRSPLFRRTLFKPDQPKTVVWSLDEPRFLQAWEPANGGLCGEWRASHGV